MIFRRSINHCIFFSSRKYPSQYLKATNIDGVTRRITHNAYIYRSSNRRTSFNGKWKLYRGQTVTTYGGSYKFKNGKRYLRVGGPHKQYIKSYNLGPVINTNTAASTDSGEETTVTVKYAYNVNIYDNQGRVIKKNIPKGTKFVVDRLEKTSFADQFIPEWAVMVSIELRGLPIGLSLFL